MATPLLEVSHLKVEFPGRRGTLLALDDISFSIAPGEILGVVGESGAGKSLTGSAIIGLLDPPGRISAGEIRFDGRRIDGLHPYQIARLGLGYVPEDRRIFTDLTVAENLEVGRQSPRAGTPRWTPAKLYELFPNLGRMQERLGGRMSGGEQQMLTIARTLMGNPRAILLDEPSEGLAPVIVEQMARTIRELKTQGLTVLLCEQNLHFARQVADRAYVIEKGHVRRAGTLDEVREEYQRV